MPYRCIPAHKFDQPRSPISGKKAFIAGVADDQGFGWAIAKCLAEAGASVSLGVWVPALNIFETSLRRGKFDESRKLSNGSLMEFEKIYPMDAVFDTLEDVPEDVRVVWLPVVLELGVCMVDTLYG